MSDNYIHLIGVERVQEAGRRIERAAEQFDRAVGRLEDALQEHSRRVEEATSRIPDMEPATCSVSLIGFNVQKKEQT